MNFKTVQETKALGFLILLTILSHCHSDLYSFIELNNISKSFPECHCQAIQQRSIAERAHWLFGSVCKLIQFHRLVLLFHCRFNIINFDTVFYRHVWMVFFVRHSLHLTSQHQWNVHEQRSTTMTSCLRKPRPQHINSQPSTPSDVSLHWRPMVPWIPNIGSLVQNAGDISRNTKSLPPGGLWSGLYGVSWKLYLIKETKDF